MSLQGKGGLAPGSQLGRYEILAKLAAGGMAVVYVARAQGVAGFERLVAIKVLHANLAHEDEFISMFLDEARLAARIRHPNVVPTTDISDNIRTGYFLVMDYIEGDHLGQLLMGAHRAEERLPVPVALRVIVDALSGLGAAHDLCDEDGKHLKLVHRDVSPHNIMIGIDGVARLTDFGVAKAEDRLTHTRDGQVKGKLAYMAPEQASTGHADARSDLFAMGVILWETLVGRRLFRADSTAATLNKLLHEEVPLLSSVDPSLKPLDALAAKALERDPDKRFQDVDEFISAIEAVAVQVGGLASLRSVGKAVKKYAADKLKRERGLIKDAIRQVRDEAGAAGSAVGSGEQELSEPSGMALDEISVSQGSMSVSKLSGVFSQPTSPGLQPAGVDDTGAPLYDADIVAQEARKGRAARLALLVVGAVMLVGLIAYALLGDGAEQVRVMEMAPDVPAPVVEASPAPTPPVAAEPAAPEPEAKVEPEPAPEAAKPAAPAAKPKPARRTPTKKVIRKKATSAPARVKAAEPPPKPKPKPKPKPTPAEPDLFMNPYAR